MFTIIPRSVVQELAALAWLAPVAPAERAVKEEMAAAALLVAMAEQVALAALAASAYPVQAAVARVAQHQAEPFMLEAASP